MGAMDAALAAAAVVAGVYSMIHYHVNQVADAPYMDEIFHVPQAQKYCHGRFHEWDPKITTFPGLYAAAVVYARAVDLIAGSKAGVSFCSTAVLRSVNVLFATGNAWLIMQLRRLLVPTDSNYVIHASLIILFPIQFFFTFLFYTDSGALFFVLLMYFLAQRVSLLTGRVSPLAFIGSAMAGVVAVSMRQTNIIWVLFVAGTIVVRLVERTDGMIIYGLSKEDARKCDTSLVRNSGFQIIFRFIRALFSNVIPLVEATWPFLLIVASFGIFVIMNRGIVVGDKSNHEAGFHGAQVLYFIFVVSTGFGPGLFAPRAVHECFTSIRRKTRTASGVIFLFVTVTMLLLNIYKFSPVHKFMLADNRHYTFYIWRKFFLKHPLAKFAPSIFYLFQGWGCWKELRQTRTPLWLLVFVVAVVLVLVPSPLVEPRYYLIPFVILHLHTPKQPSSAIVVTVIVYSVVNIFTMYAFLYRPYTWVDGSTARFMW